LNLTLGWETDIKRVPKVKFIPPGPMSDQEKDVLFGRTQFQKR